MPLVQSKAEDAAEGQKVCPRCEGWGATIRSIAGYLEWCNPCKATGLVPPNRDARLRSSH